MMTAPATGSDIPNYAAILWDNDGVLVDTERWYFQATRDVFAEAGIDLTTGIYFDYFLANSNGTSRFARAHGLGEADIDALVELRNARYLRLLEREHIVIEGVRETLAALRPHFAMGIVTSSRRSHLEAIHARAGLLPFFDFAITHEDYPLSKPAPDPYLAAVARTGLPASKCLAIEDAPRGLTAARAAGLDCWVIPTELTRGVPFAGATRLLTRVADVASLLLHGKLA
ncbi:MAG: HAD family phosphatase [Dehalococcoidia bacterium]